MSGNPGESPSTLELGGGRRLLREAENSYARMPIAVLRDGTLAAGPRLLWATLVSYAWGDKTTCWPGEETLGADLGTSTRNLRRWMRVLQDRGLVAVRRHGLGQTNVYTLHEPAGTPAS